jgi:hypothetical protein
LRFGFLLNWLSIEMILGQSYFESTGLSFGEEMLGWIRLIRVDLTLPGSGRFPTPPAKNQHRILGRKFKRSASGRATFMRAACSVSSL